MSAFGSCEVVLFTRFLYLIPMEYEKTPRSTINRYQQRGWYNDYLSGLAYNPG